MTTLAFQDLYPDELGHCYGCGKNNDHGLQIKSFWEGKETVAHFEPRPEHTALPGYVYGGLIASLIDCHGTGSAAAAAYKANGRDMGSEPALRFVTANLNVDFLAPTPMGETLELRGKIKEIKEKKVIVEITVFAKGKACAKGSIVCVKMPASMMPS
ncbi:Thioesterase superfamily protein [Candidatus Terasakiella magnetica]|uniref:Acyl-coenzyme A thioesterase THEM4 n=1 Tax=Candidatus Terasakiella magnetica TaxID=1867952 RepID=A0A1C3RDZ0_9PROT|nr:PaaI family thioesterase [Candidatus Terasakiella magnetica]SCA55452.1 Thioesterase superfamily protein [Candidatus Terasakiella magnetica]